MLDFSVARLGYLANLGVALFLLAAAAVVARRLRVPGRLALAAFLALVGANYALDAASYLAYFVGAERIPLQNAGYLIGAFDPPMLSAFALAFAGWRVSPAVRALLLAPSLLFVAQGLVLLARGPVALTSVQQPVMIPILAGHYLLALVLVARAHHQALTPRERELRAAVVAIVALIVLPRLPLLLIDAGIGNGAARAQPDSLLRLELPLALLALGGAWLFVRTAPAEARASALGVVRHAALLLALVAAAWLLRLAPGFSAAAFALLYSARWIVFAGALGIDAQRQRLLGLPASVGGPARGSFLALLGFVGAVEVAALLYALPGASLVGALVGGVAFTALAFVGAAAVARRRLADEEARVLKRRVYRAHLELGAPPDRLPELRAQLDLAADDAAEEERLARASR
ncbi:MAG TPA: hypothetical protein VM582_08825, partial [Candidatus Thermoplasmatota archaeon]|nr:hypothetical protein [Candidatus Thermoplasmatota archaeon]